MRKTILQILLTFVFLSVLVSCDENDKSMYSFHAYNESLEVISTGTFHLHFNDGQVTGNFSIKPNNYFHPYSSGNVSGHYTDSTVFINCPDGLQDSGNALDGTFDGNKIVGNVIQGSIAGSYVIGTFVLKHK